MRLKLTAEVEGSVFLTSPFSFTKGTTIYDFKTTLEGKLLSVSLSEIVPQEKTPNLKSTIELDNKGDVPQLTIGGDKGTYKSLEEGLQLLESSFSFFSAFGIRKINWATPRVDYIPESEDEEELVPFHSVQFGRDSTETILHIQSKVLEFIVKNSDKETKMIADMAFWREGKYFAANNQFIHAFYCFYYIIEDLVAHGHWSESEVRKYFRRSKQFGYICQESFAEIRTLEHWLPSLKAICQFDILNPLNEDIFKLIWDTRGALHHYSSKRKDNKPFSLIEDDYACMSALLDLITQRIIISNFGVVPFQPSIRIG